MITHIQATYANGVLTPDSPLNLAEQSRVKVTVELVEGSSTEKHENISHSESFRNWIQENPLNFGGMKCSREELYERD